MSKNKRCYYEVLGVNKSATESEIKKAYKKMAIKWHPDKNLDNKAQAQQKFRQIAEAYETLSNAEKRSSYDKYGFDGPSMKGFSNFGFGDAEDIFSHFFQNNFDGDEEDDLFGKFFKKRNGGKNGKSGFGMGNFGFGSSLFEKDDFFKDNGGFSSFSSSSFSNNGPTNFTSKTVSSTTQVINGKSVTVKKTTQTKPDGTKVISQQTIDGNKKSIKQYQLQKGQSKNQAKKLKK